MKYIVYVSQANTAFTTSELAALLEVSRKNNSAEGISGLLIYRYNPDYRRGNFLQVLEGDGHALDALWSKISEDPRHHTIVVLEEGDCETRMFGDWSMGFRNVDEADLAKFTGFSELGSDTFWETASQRSLSNSLTLLRSFYDGA